MEPPDAEKHYTERLVRLPNLSIYYAPLETSPVRITRGEFGMRPEAIVFWSGQSLYKYLPQHDFVFAKIAKFVGNCLFIESMSTDRFIAAIGNCDIFLDSIGWSGCNSTLESLVHNLRVVTLRGGAYARSS
jgi:predicted O-linked N-acetylglucosamine transferase (SPINDLY family)